MTINPFLTKFVADTDVAVVSSDESADVTMTIDGTTILHEHYVHVNGYITVRGLRNVLESALYGDLAAGPQAHASGLVELFVGSVGFQQQMFASRLRNPRDPRGVKTVLAAGDLVAVARRSQGSFAGDGGCLYSHIQGSTVYTSDLDYVPGTMGGGSYLLGDDIRLWVDFSECADRCVAVRFLNRYDVPQTMMTTRPLEVRPGFTDQTAVMYGRHVRYAVEQNDEYVLRSGRIHSIAEYASWGDLITSRKAEVWLHGQWLPIIVTKSNYSQIHHSVGLVPVEISFRMADPRQGL